MAETPLRFIRVLTASGALENPAILGKRVPWLNKLQVFASNTQTLSAECDFQQGRVVGMDAASALAVELLDPIPGMRVLDVCCAPGMKLIALADLLQKQGTLIGVDVNESRLFTTCAVLRKYNVCMPTTAADDDETKKWEMNLYQQDGRIFNRISQQGKLMWSVDMNKVFVGEKPLKTPRKRVSGKGLKKKLSKVAALTTTAYTEKEALFDRVLVDAECTTDARLHNSLPQQHNQDDSTATYTKRPKVFTKEEELETQELQFALLTNGFRQLKPGGMLIYSTCSMMQGQNEDVVRRLLECTPQAQLVPLPKLPELVVEETKVSPQETVGVWRLTPQVSGTSGLFLAKITKMLL